MTPKNTDQIIAEFNTEHWRGNTDDDDERGIYYFTEATLRTALAEHLLYAAEEFKDSHEAELVAAGRNNGIRNCYDKLISLAHQIIK